MPAQPATEASPPDMANAAGSDDLVDLTGFGHGRLGLIILVSFAWVLWQMRIAATLPLPPLEMRSIHMSFGYVLAFLMWGGFKKVKHWWVRLAADLLLGALSVWVFVHLFLHFSSPDVRRLVDPPTLDIALGFLALGLTIWIVWRVSGLSLALTAAAFMAYAFFGQHLPTAVGHGGFSTERLMSFFYLRLEGLLGVAVGASAVLIFPVVIFGSLLVAMGGGAFFSRLAMALFGRFRGGSAKIAVAASGFFGMVSGTGPANVATTGVFTIPLMKRGGFSPLFAAAVEPSASIGGQLLPPIMGAAAFVMADFLQTSYSQVIRHAIIPAILFYLTLLITVDIRAARLGMKGLPRKEAEPVWPILKEGWHFLVPLGILIYSLAIRQFSVPRGAYFATVSLLVLDLGIRLIRRRPLEPHRLVQGVVGGARSAAVVATAVGAVQIVIASVGLTGIGIKLSSLLLDLAGGNLLVLLILTMLASLLLGTGLPTVPTYLILAILTAPALVELGVPLIAAHFFVFYFGVMSDLTPPTALGPTVAAGIAGAPLMRTMMESMRLSISGWVLPFMFVYTPALVLVDATRWEIAYSFGFALVAVTALAIALAGFFMVELYRWEIVAFLGASALMIHPEVWSSLVGVAAASGLIVLLAMRRRTEAVAVAV